MKSPAHLLGAFVITCLVACQPSLVVSLASEGETLPSPAFLVSDPEHPERPHYDSVRLYHLDGRLLWHLRAEPFGTEHSVEYLRYGEPPRHFDTLVEPLALVAGGEYSIQVSGRARGTLRFHVTKRGRVLPLDE